MSFHGNHWTLDPEVTFLNHGSFGACPQAVLAAQQEYRSRLEREPVRFFNREAPGLLRESRQILGEFIGADPEDLAFVTNATTAVNAVLRSIPLSEGDELVVTDHEYNACRNALEFVAAERGCTVRLAHVPYPIAGEDDVVDAVLEAVTDRTRLVLIDHVTSQTALVFPVGRIVSELHSRGVSVLVDGAHAPGMLSLDLEGIGADYYTGNCHKWVCAPKGSAFLYVRPDLQGGVRPAVISHGANAGFAGRERFRVEFDWMGTADPTAWICVGAAIRCMGSLLPGGWSALREYNHALVLAGRRIVAEALGVGVPSPDEMIGSMASLPLPPSPGFEAPRSALDLDPLHDWLFARNVEVPILGCPAVGFRLLRISAQLYNQTRDYERLAALLRNVDWD